MSALNVGEYYGKGEEPGDINTIEDKDEKAVLKESAFVRSTTGRVIEEGGTKVRPMKRWKWVAVAAALLGVVASGISLYIQNPKQRTAIAINSNKEKSTKSRPSSNNSLLKTML